MLLSTKHSILSFSTDYYLNSILSTILNFADVDGIVVTIVYTDLLFYYMGSGVLVSKNPSFFGISS